jgi:hypothetical protein
MTNNSGLLPSLLEGFPLQTSVDGFPKGILGNESEFCAASSGRTAKLAKFDLENTPQSLYTIICYSHTDYLDILNVQNSYLLQYPEEKILLINENNMKHTQEFTNSTSCFRQILYYNDSLNYPKKIYNTLCNINIKNKHIIFLHDNDILIQKKQENIIKIINLMNNHNIHRVDFQNWYHKRAIFDDIIPVYDNASIRKTLNDDYYYNVNPSIWELKSFLELMNKF